MGINITIQEGGVGKQLTVDKISITLTGGGTCLWVPEPRMGNKTITENGTYNASTDGYDGFTQVVVNVPNGGNPGGGGYPSGGVIAVDDDGNETYNYRDPDTGKLVTAVIPSSIEVTTPPNVTLYGQGAYIGTDGMVITTYDANGNVLGTVPLSEITIDPTTAVYDQSTYTDGGDIADIDKAELTYPDDLTLPIGPMNKSLYVPGDGGHGDTHTLYGDGYIIPYMYDGRVNLCAVAKTAGAYVIVERYDGATMRTNLSSLNRYYGVTNLPTWASPDGTVQPATTITKTISLMIQDIADAVFDGTITQKPSGSNQIINVTWPRPGDGETMETSFNITVVQGPSGNDDQ